MCYAIPGKVLEVKDNIAIIDYFGEQRKAMSELDLQPGEYVYAQGGIVINKIPENEALEILEIWKTKFFELKKIDSQLSIDPLNEAKNSQTISDNLLGILQKVNLGKKLEKEEILTLLKVTDKDELSLLYSFANNIRQKVHDNACCVHGIIEFSNHCKQNCKYCGIRRDASCSDFAVDSENCVKRYRMSKDDIIKTAKHAADELKFKALVLQSGEDDHYTDDMLCEIIKEIRKLDVLVFISFGMRSKESYEKFYDAGARAILLRFETSNQEIFNNIRPETSFEERIELIKYAKELGFVVATGFIQGFPEETEEDILNNLMLTKELGAEMYSFGPLIPTKGTPLQNQPMIGKDQILKTIAVTRIIDNDCNILVTTAMETLDKNAKKQGLLAGGNSLMINVTPYEFRKLYGIYENRIDRDIEIEDNIEETIDLLYSLGRAPTDIGI